MTSSPGPIPPPRRARLPLLALIAAATCAVALALHGGGVLKAPERATLDARMQMRSPAPPADLLVVAIDDIAYGGQWPWPRTLHARAIDRLTAAGARTIAYDVQFTEPSATFADAARNEEADYALFEAIRRSRRVVLATTEVASDGSTNVLGGDANVAAAHAVVGAANFPTGTGGVIRRMSHNLQGLPSLAVAAASHATGRPVPTSWFPSDGALIDYAGPPGTVLTVRFADLLAGRVPAHLIRGKIAVVGVSAPTLHDLHATPVAPGQLMAGAEVQANAISTVLREVPLRQVPSRWDVLAIVVMGLVAPLVAARCRTRWVLAAFAVAALGYPVVAWMLFGNGHVLAVAAPLAALALGTAGSLVMQYLAESAERRALRWYSATLEATVRQRTAELRDAHVDVVRRLAQAAEFRESETGDHIVRVGALCTALARRLGLPDAAAEDLGLAAALHDVGKIAVPDRVLLKPGRLDAEDWEVMRAHAARGADLLSGSRSTLLVQAEEIARTHHEHWDGAGYPAGLAGDDIPLAGRICAICDVFDALLSHRPYKPPWTLDATLTEIAAQSGRQFDPRVAEAFLAIAPELHDRLDYAGRRGLEAPRRAA